MLSVPRWLAVYAFLGEQWQGRRRVLADPVLEQALRRRQASFGPPGSPARDLLDGLAPEAPGRARVWRVVWDAGAGDDQAGRAGGAKVIAAEQAAARLRGDVAWEVALVRASAWPRGGPREELLAVLSEGAARGRTVILLEPLARAERVGGGVEAALERLTGLLTADVGPGFGRARLYALAAVDGASVIDCGGLAEEEDDAGDEDIPVVFDNTLASETPRYSHVVALANGVAPPVGMTLVELPGDDEPAAPGLGEAGAAGETSSSSLRGTIALLRRQHARSRRQAELSEVARQASLAELERARADCANLEARVHALERDLAEALELRSQALEPARGVPSSGLEDARADALRAGLVAARWELEQAALEIERLTLRPVEALEAEIASLRVQLESSPKPNTTPSST